MTDSSSFPISKKGTRKGKNLKTILIISLQIRSKLVTYLNCFAKFPPSVNLFVFSMLTLSKISKRYGPKILFREVSLRMMRGEKMGLVGANGAGKTTLFSILLGEVDEDEGKIEWERGTRIGYLPQDSAPTGE